MSNGLSSQCHDTGKSRLVVYLFLYTKDFVVLAAAKCRQFCFFGPPTFETRAIVLDWFNKKLTVSSREYINAKWTAE